MSNPVNCGTTFCSCIECVVPLRTMTRDELNTEIVVAISVFRAAKREELEKAVKDASDTRTAAGDIYAASVAAYIAAVDIYAAALAALADYDKENT